MRLLVWLVGLLFACLPLLVQVWVAEPGIMSVFDIDNYWTRVSEIYFIAAAIGGVALFELFELSTYLGSTRPARGKNRLQLEQDLKRVRAIIGVAAVLLLCALIGSLIRVGILAVQPYTNPASVNGEALYAWLVVALCAANAFVPKIIRVA